MRFRTHAISSALAGIVLYPRSPMRAATVLLSGTLIDLDHLALYIFRTGDWSLTGALTYDRYRHQIGVVGDTRPRYSGLRSWLHNPLVLLLPLWALAIERPALRPAAIGLTLHLCLDYMWWPRYTLAFWQSGRRCDRCGRSDRKLMVYWHREWGEPTMRTLCKRCFESSTQSIAGS